MLLGGLNEPVPTSRVDNTNEPEEAGTKRSAILEAAMRMFLTHGYRATSMDLVAIESGARRSTVYNQFKSKRALFDAALSRLWEDLPLDRITERTVAESNPRKTLLAVGNAIADFWTPDEAIAFVRMIVAESVHFPELGAAFSTIGGGNARKILVSCLKRLSQQGSLTIADVDLAASQFIGLLIEPLLLSRLISSAKAPNTARRRQLVDEAVETFLARYSS